MLRAQELHNLLQAAMDFSAKHHVEVSFDIPFAKYFILPDGRYCYYLRNGIDGTTNETATELARFRAGRIPTRASCPLTINGTPDQPNKRGYQMNEGLVLLAVLAVLALYFFPTIMAYSFHHRAIGGIFVINLFLGWTLLGWVGALAWAATAATGPVK